MGKKILKTFTNNLGFKILAVIFAFLLWLIVYNLNDPIKTKTFSTTVSVTGEDGVIDMGKWATVDEQERTISFSVSAKRSILAELDDSDFYANANMAELKMDEDDNSKASTLINIGCSKYKNSITINGGEKYLELNIEEYMQKQFEVKVSITGNLSENKAIGNQINANPKVVKVGGPKSLISKIKTASVSISVDENTIISDGQISDRGELKLFDEDGKEINQSLIHVDSQYQSIEVTVGVLNTKEVPVKCAYKGIPAGGKSVLSVETSKNSVMLKGPADKLNNITSIEIGPIDVTGTSENVVTTVDLSGYLPEGVYLVDSADSSVKVTLKIETNATQNFVINSSNITCLGLGKDMEVQFSSELTNVMISGNESDIKAIRSSAIRGTVDATGLKPGTHTVTVKLNLDDAKYTWSDVKLQITITQNESPDQNNPDGAANQDRNEGTTGNTGDSGNTGGQDDTDNN